MHIPDEFKEVRSEEIASIVQNFPLACVVANTPNGLIATHIPLILKPNGVLVGHIAMVNDMRTLVADNQEVMCVFKGDDAYISANYYPSKWVDHQKVPTWNYQAVHIYGNLTFFTDKKSKLSALGMLTKQSEQQANGSSAWKMSEAPADYLAALLEDIVVFEVQISRVLAQSKLSQNRDQKDFDSVVAELKLRGKEGVADSMLRLKRD